MRWAPSRLTRLTAVTGAGASFPAAPIYSKWAEAYNKATGNQINYQSVGSGAGIKQINAKRQVKDSSAASDMPLKDDDLDEAAGLMQFPTVIGGVVPVINVAGVKPGQLKLTGTVLADIYLGKVTKWNDPAITALKPGRHAAGFDRDRRCASCADGSGTSFIFHELPVQGATPTGRPRSAEGTGRQPGLPSGLAGKGNEGVAQNVQRLPNSIGFMFEYRLCQAEARWTTSR